MPRKRRPPPSRVRYEQANPTISVRVSRGLYDQLKQLKAQSGKSIGDVLREAMGKQKASVGLAYSRGHRRGFSDAERRYRTDYRCCRCGGTLTIESENEKRAVATYMREYGWAHDSCIDSR